MLEARGSRPEDWIVWMRCMNTGPRAGDGDTGPRRMRLLIEEGEVDAMYEARSPPMLWPTRFIFSDISRM